MGIQRIEERSPSKNLCGELARRMIEGLATVRTDRRRRRRRAAGMSLDSVESSAGPGGPPTATVAHGQRPAILAQAPGKTTRSLDDGPRHGCCHPPCKEEEDKRDEEGGIMSRRPPPVKTVCANVPRLCSGVVPW